MGPFVLFPLSIVFLSLSLSSGLFVCCFLLYMFPFLFGLSPIVPGPCNLYVLYILGTILPLLSLSLSVSLSLYTLLYSTLLSLSASLFLSLSLSLCLPPSLSVTPPSSLPLSLITPHDSLSLSSSLSVSLSLSLSAASLALSLSLSLPFLPCSLILQTL